VGNRFGRRGEIFVDRAEKGLSSQYKRIIVMKAKGKVKTWILMEKMALPRYYLQFIWSMEQLAEHFRCSKSEIRRKLKEVGAWQR